MRSTLNLKAKNKSGSALIYLKAYFKDENKKFVYSTGEVISPDDWDSKLKQPFGLAGRTPKAVKLRLIQKQLNRYTNFFSEITDLYKNTEQEITIDSIRGQFDKEFKKVSPGKNKFYDAYDDFMIYKIKNQDWGTSTVKRYDNIKNILKDFEKDKKYKLTFNTITGKFYTEFTDYCMSEKGHINNTFSRNVGLFKTFMLWSLKNGYTYKTDFTNFKKKPRVVTNQIALKIDDLRKLMIQEFETKKLEKVRDVFVFSCVTGMRFGELKLISKTNIFSDNLLLKEEKGSGKEAREIPLNDIALFILRKYNYKLPLIANQKHNDYIKDVFKEAGYIDDVEKTTTRGKEVIRETMPFYDRISSHTSRRTFITMMKRKGKSDKLIAKITGHNDMKTLNQYYQVSDEEVNEAVKETFSIEIPLLKKVR